MTDAETTMPNDRTLEGAARALIEKLDACGPAIGNAFIMAAMHGSTYSGPTYGEELEALRRALDPKDAGASGETGRHD